jgi:hypothetical protein
VRIYETKHWGQKAFLIVQGDGVIQPGGIGAQICSEDRLRVLKRRTEKPEGLD